MDGSLSADGSAPPDPAALRDGMLPVVIVPGFCSSCLEVEESSVTPSWQGCKVWLGLSRLGFQAVHGKGTWDNPADRSLKNKWLQHLALKSPAEESEGIHLRAVPGVAGIKHLDPDSFFGLTAEATYIFAPVITALEEMGYKEGEDLAAASYDWRFAPSLMQKREGYFERLRETVEELDRRGTGVVLLAHSMGNKTVQYFLEYARRACGQAWLDKHIYSWIAAGAPFLGSPSAARSTVQGDKFGMDLFITDSEAIAFARSLSASQWLFPIGKQAERPMYFLRRGGVLEVRHLEAAIANCGMDSTRNHVMLSVQVSWGDGSDTECLTTKSSVEFDGNVARFDDDANILQFGGPAELPENATIEVIVKEKGFHDDSDTNPLKRISKGVVAGVQLIGEAVQGRRGMGVPKANTSVGLLSELLREGKQGKEDGFIDVRLPIASVRGWSSPNDEEASVADYVCFQARWLDFRGLRAAWLGSQELAPSNPSMEAPVRCRGRPEAVYDPVEIPQLLRLEACEGLMRMWRDYYEGDDCYNHTGTNDCPPIKRLVAVHGVNMPTEVMFALRINTVRFKPTVKQNRLVLDDEAELISADGSLCIEGGIVKDVGGEVPSGDGVVSLCSMDHCKDWAGQLDLTLIHLENLEHRAILADAQFHCVIRDALTLQRSAEASSASEVRGCPALSYSIAGTWSNWAPAPMEWDGVCFSYLVKVGDKGWESFQILLGGSWDTVIYPSMKDASPDRPHELQGPDKMNRGKDWTIGRPGFNPLRRDTVRPGTEFKVSLAVDDQGRASGVNWQICASARHLEAHDVGRWQATKNDSEWWDFPAEACGRLEAARATGCPMAEVEVGRWRYEIDLHLMVQRNLVTGTKRAIRRLER